MGTFNTPARWCPFVDDQDRYFAIEKIKQASDDINLIQSNNIYNDINLGEIIITMSPHSELKSGYHDGAYFDIEIVLEFQSDQEYHKMDFNLYEDDRIVTDKVEELVLQIIEFSSIEESIDEDKVNNLYKRLSDMMYSNIDLITYLIEESLIKNNIRKQSFGGWCKGYRDLEEASLSTRRSTK